MAIIQSGASADLLTVDPTSKAGRVTLYDSAGNAMVKADKTAGGVTPGTTPGMLTMGADYKTPVLNRSASDGSLIVGDRYLLLYDRAEGAAVNTNTWIQTTTTMTITQATGVITLNANNTATTTTGAMHTSHHFLPFPSRSALIGKFRVKPNTHQANNLHEIGFGSPATATGASIANGACWRKDGTGQWVPVISIGGSEVLGTPISNATFIASVSVTDFAIFEIFLQNNRAVFSIWTTTGTLVASQNIDLAATSTSFQQTHLQAFYRTYNSGASTAVQLLVDDVSVWISDFQLNKPWRETMSGMGYNSTTSPTAYTQLSNYTNSAAPTTRTFTNTTAAETTLGGLLVANSIAGGVTDYIMFGFQVPSPYTFYFTGIRIAPPLNQVVAVATTATVFCYAVAFNSSAVSLATGAPYPPMRVALGGCHTAAVALAANAIFSGNDVMWFPQTPIAVQAGRFLHVIVRELVGTATATETYFWNVSIDGYFE